jgi:hypothetical protein
MLANDGIYNNLGVLIPLFVFKVKEHALNLHFITKQESTISLSPISLDKPNSVSIVDFLNFFFGDTPTLHPCFQFIIYGTWYIFGIESHVAMDPMVISLKGIFKYMIEFMINVLVIKDKND